MAKIYFAAPLFCDMERERNIKECALLEAAGHEVYLPQRDGGEAITGIDRQVLFNRDVEALEWCDTVIAYVDGRVPDEGMCFEIGYGYAKRKAVYMVSTDARSFEEGVPNAMILHAGPWMGSTQEVLAAMEVQHEHA